MSSYSWGDRSGDVSDQLCTSVVAGAVEATVQIA
jgi:hypothetical protein